MRSNLPPGVTESMIPGNEPENEEKVERKPFWRCESCGYQDRLKSMPKDRDKFYARGKAAKCPSCKSEDLMPVGF